MATADAPGPDRQITPEFAIEELGKRLYSEMENLDPSEGKTWEELRPDQREYCRLLVVGVVEGKGDRLLEALIDFHRQDRLPPNMSDHYTGVSYGQEV